MPAFSLNARKNRVKQSAVTLPNDGGSFDIWYRPSVMTPAFLREMDATEKNYEKTVAMIVRMVARWDIYAEVDPATGAGIGEPLPVAPESIEGADFEFLNAIINAVTADMNPDPTPPSATGSGS